MSTETSEKVLAYLEKHDSVNSLVLSDLWNLDHQKIVGTIKSLQSLGDLINADQVSHVIWELLPEGREIEEKGSHEALLFQAIPEEGADYPDILKHLAYGKVGFNKAMSLGWVTLDKSGQKPKLFRKVTTIDDTVQKHLQLIRNRKESEVPANTRQEYKKRKLLHEIDVKSYQLSRGKDFSLSITRLETDLTPEMITTSSWKSKQFKSYNFNAMGAPTVRGHLHPLLKVRAEFRQIFLEMGYTEMATNKYVENCFWNFDAIFQPQQHPARDIQDTFFLTEPKYSEIGPEDYVEKVKKVHSVGDFESKGYGSSWSYDEARKNVLRTHTTAVTSHMLYKLAKEPVFHPVKYFSIDRVFRNETLDATHLAEFFQIEGVVMDYGLTLGDLIGTLHQFYRKLGISKLRFKPAYNPYTEPSMEVFSYHDGLKKWVEIGNSGLFRPEMLLPMGFPPGVTAIAWGLSLERPAMIKYGINNIRDLVGPRVNLQMVYDNPICRLDM